MEIVTSISHVSLPMQYSSHVGEARRAARSIAGELGFSEEESGKLAIIVTEAATNLAVHAQQGEMLLCPYLADGQPTIDVIALDRGPGIPDIAQSLADGFSTAGTAGNGLGAIARLSDFFDIYSDRSTGTILLSRICGRSRRNSETVQKYLHVGLVCVPVKGEVRCGDTIAVRVSNHSGMFMIADGLGHGIGAHQASQEAGKIFSDSGHGSPAQVLDNVHRGLRATRGAAAALAEIDCDSGIVRFAGIGNIASAILNGQLSRSLISHNGIVGHQAHKIQEFTYPWDPSSMLIMNSDGLQTNWRLAQYPGLLRKDPAIVAAVLYRDFSRGRDDVAVLVIKQQDENA